VRTLYSTPLVIAEHVSGADLVIGAVLVPGARAPKLVSNDLVAAMPAGSVLVDIAIDQGGCFADSHPTTHDAPTFPVHGSLMYCVTNMPGAVPRTATFALTNATLPYILAIAARGVTGALRDDLALRRGLNTANGDLRNTAVAAAHGLPVP
jgi:alanine dehydrogenase